MRATSTFLSKFIVIFSAFMLPVAVQAQTSYNNIEDLVVFGVPFGSEISANPYQLSRPLRMDGTPQSGRSSGRSSSTSRRSCESFVRRWSLGMFPTRFQSQARAFEGSMGTSVRIGFENNGSVDTSLGGRVTGGWYTVPEMHSLRRNSSGEACFIYLDNKLFSIFINDIPHDMPEALSVKYNDHKALLGGLYHLNNGVTIWWDIRRSEVSYVHYPSHFIYLESVVPIYLQYLRNSSDSRF